MNTTEETMTGQTVHLLHPSDLLPGDLMVCVTYPHNGQRDFTFAGTVERLTGEYPKASIHADLPYGHRGFVHLYYLTHASNPRNAERYDQYQRVSGSLPAEAWVMVIR